MDLPFISVQESSLEAKNDVVTGDVFHVNLDKAFVCVLFCFSAKVRIRH